MTSENVMISALHIVHSQKEIRKAFQSIVWFIYEQFLPNLLAHLSASNERRKKQ